MPATRDMVIRKCQCCGETYLVTPEEDAEIEAGEKWWAAYEEQSRMHTTFLRGLTIWVTIVMCIFQQELHWLLGRF